MRLGAMVSLDLQVYDVGRTLELDVGLKKWRKCQLLDSLGETNSKEKWSLGKHPPRLAYHSRVSPLCLAYTFHVAKIIAAGAVYTRLLPSKSASLHGIRRL